MVNYKKGGSTLLVIREIQTKREQSDKKKSLTIPSVGNNVEKWEHIWWENKSLKTILGNNLAVKLKTHPLQPGSSFPK